MAKAKSKKRSRRSKIVKKTPGSLIKLKENYDAPPSNAGIQNVPKSLKEFMKLKELGGQCSEKAKKQKKQAQKENISSQAYQNRNQVPNLMETSNRKTVYDNSRTKSISHDPNMLKLSRSSNIKQKRKKKLLKLKLKRELKKDQKKAEVEEDEAAVTEFVKDDIKFGETVHRPPQFSVLPRKASKVDNANRPGRKDDLLLKTLLSQAKENTSKMNLCGQRKHLSMSDQRQIEAERQKAMLQYRNAKMKRLVFKKKVS